MKLAAVAECFRRLRAGNPHPQPELVFQNVFELLVAVMLSAQATDRSVNLATKGLFARASTPQAMLALGEAQVAEAIHSIGLYRTKARNVVRMCALLIERHGGEVPGDRAALEALPGVGRKTANVVLNVGFGQPTIAVDTHIFRVANRTGIAPGRSVLAVERGLLARVPEEYLQDAHHWLLLHGRYVCTARRPRCPECVLRDLCEYPDKTVY